MPKVSKKGLKYNKKYDNETIQETLEDISNNGIPKKAAAKKYGIPRSTLQFRLSDKFTKISKGPRPILSAEEEEVLVKWILESHRKGFPRRKEDLQISVKGFLDEKPRPNPFKNNIPGEGWYKAFLKRNPMLCERVPESVTAASSCVSESDIRKWFADIELYLKEEGYMDILNDPSRVFNSDETCFLLCPKTKTVLAPRGARNVYEVENAPGKSNLTVLFTLSACGEVTPPFIIYPYKRLPASIATSVPDDWGIGTSANGWMKAELFYEYVANVFHPYLIKRNTTFPIILFVDGHSTHTNYQLSQLCSQLKIILICLYGNSTRILQPADVATFKPLKSYWKKGVIEWRRFHSCEMLTQDKFAPLLKTVIDTYLKADVIINGFVATGLCPWNPNAIDYSKCLGKTKTPTHACTMEKTDLSYNKFANIVGDDLLNKFKMVEEVTGEETDEFWILYKLWREFNRPTHDIHDTDTTKHDQNAVQDKKGNENTPEPVIINIFDSVNNQKENNDFFNIEEMPIIFEDLESSQLESNMLEQNYSNTSVDENNKSIKEYLVWPESPVRKGKRNVERLPFVLTSAAWKKMQLDKQEKKNNEEKQKEERKRKREERKEEQNEKKRNKNELKLKCFKKQSLEPNNTTALIHSSDNTENQPPYDNCSQFENYEIRAKSALEHAKRDLFKFSGDDKSDK